MDTFPNLLHHCNSSVSAEDTHLLLSERHIRKDCLTKMVAAHHFLSLLVVICLGRCPTWQREDTSSHCTCMRLHTQNSDVRCKILGEMASLTPGNAW